MACRILVPGPGIEPMPSAGEAQSLNHLDHQRSPFFFLYICILFKSILKIHWPSPKFTQFTRRKVFLAAQFLSPRQTDLLASCAFRAIFFFSVCSATAKSLQSCPTLCKPIDGSPPSSPVPGILQARTLEWVAISFSKAWKWKVKVKSLSHIQHLATPWTAAYQAPLSMGFSRQQHWSGVYSCAGNLWFRT